jgi:hypothetical protein
MKMITGIVILVVIVCAVCLYGNMNKMITKPSFNSMNNNIVLVPIKNNSNNSNNSCCRPKSAQELRQAERKPERFDNLPLPLRYKVNGKPNNFDMAYANSTLLVLP